MGNKHQWNSNQNTKLFIHKKAYEDVVNEMAAILSRGRWVKTLPGNKVSVGVRTDQFSTFNSMNLFAWCQVNPGSSNCLAPTTYKSPLEPKLIDFHETKASIGHKELNCVSHNKIPWALKPRVQIPINLYMFRKSTKLMMISQQRFRQWLGATR